MTHVEKHMKRLKPDRRDPARQTTRACAHGAHLLWGRRSGVVEIGLCQKHERSYWREMRRGSRVGRTEGTQAGSKCEGGDNQKDQRGLAWRMLRE